MSLINVILYDKDKKKPIWFYLIFRRRQFKVPVKPALYFYTKLFDKDSIYFFKAFSSFCYYYYYYLFHFHTENRMLQRTFLMLNWCNFVSNLSTLLIIMFYEHTIVARRVYNFIRRLFYTDYRTSLLLLRYGRHASLVDFVSFQGILQKKKKKQKT